MKPAKTGGDWVITDCEGCGATPVRDDSTEQRGTYNWMLTCAHCNGRRCIVCLPPDQTVCSLCRAELAA